LRNKVLDAIAQLEGVLEQVADQEHKVGEARHVGGICGW
jgi:hypothetical protein